MNVAVEGKWVGDACSAEGDDELPIGEEGEDRNGVERWEDSSEDLRYCIPYRKILVTVK